MRASGISCRSYQTNQISGLYVIPDSTAKFRHMCIPGRHAVSVINDHQVAVSSVVFTDNNCTACTGIDAASIAGTKVQTIVETLLVVDRMPAISVQIRCQRGIAGPRKLTGSDSRPGTPGFQVGKIPVCIIIMISFRVIIIREIDRITAVF